MATRILSLAALCSATMFCLIVVAWFAAGSVDPRKQFVSLHSSCHFSIDARGADARLEVFNDSSYGPYCGSIVGPIPRFSGFGDTAGIYYRHIQWPDGTLLWTLSLSLAYPLIVSAVLPLAWFVRRRRRGGRGFPVEGRPVAG